MFGKITEINGNSCIVENISHVTHSELMNCHVVFPESDRLVVGEIIKIGEEKITILLVGEIRSNRFFPGVVKKPSTTPRIINVNELELIIGKQTKDIRSLWPIAKEKKKKKGWWRY